MSLGQRAKGKEQRAKTSEQRAGGRQQRALWFGSLCSLLFALCLLLPQARSAPTNAGNLVGVFRGAGLARDPVSEKDVDRAAAAVEWGLDRFGIGYRLLEDTQLSDLSLRPFDVVILPYNQLSEANVAALRRFGARGGRWIAYMARMGAGQSPLDPMLGIKSIPTEGGFTPRSLLPAPRDGMPVRIALVNPPSPRPCAALDPAFDAGKWEKPSEISALVRGPSGYYVNTLPAADRAQSELLLAMLGDLEPVRWAEALETTRAQAARAVTAAGMRWAEVRRQPEPTREQRERIEIELRTQRDRIPPAETPAPEVDANRALLAARVQDAVRVQDDIRRLCCQMSPSRKGEVRAVALSMDSRSDWEDVMRRLRDAGLNTVIVRAGRGGSVIYPSEVLPAEPWAAGPDELKLALDAARKYGIQFHAGRTAFQLGGAPKEFYDRMAAEDRLVRDPEGRQAPFLNPADPRNQEQELRAVLELVQKYDLDGLELDSFRYPDEPHSDWDYGPVSRREFEKASGRPVERWPVDVLSGSRKQEYEEWERDTISRLVERLSTEVKKLKPQLQLSAAVSGDPRRGRAEVKQDWGLWAQRGWLDFLVPMDASAGQDTLAAQLEAQVSLTRGKTLLVAGIGSGPLDEALDGVCQVETAREQGADGFVLFASDRDSVDEQLAALRAGATAEGTWPAYLAPRAEWGLTGAVDRKNAPLAFAAGDRVQLDARLLSQSPLKAPLKAVDALVRLEDTSGRLLATVVAVNAFEPKKARFEVPTGRFRPVIRGNVSFRDGVVRPFVVRGPLCDGLGIEELTALRGEETPPVPIGEGRKVGVYAGGLGAGVLLNLLGSIPSMSAVPLYRLQPSHLMAVQVLILPQAADVEDLSPEAVQALRNWVSEGGTILLTHDAVGARSHPRMFPEVGVGAGVGAERSLVFARDLGAFKTGSPLEHASADHVRITPGPGVEILLREPGEAGAPVAVSGSLGKGRVLLYGAAPGCGPREMAEAERTLLRILLGPS